MYRDILKCVEQFKLWTSVTWYEPLNLWHDDNSLVSMMINPFNTLVQVHMIHELTNTTVGNVCMSTNPHENPTQLSSTLHYHHVLSTLHHYHALQLTLLPMNPQMASSVRWSAIRCWCICRFSWQQHKIESNLLWTSKCTTTD